MTTKPNPEHQKLASTLCLRLEQANTTVQASDKPVELINGIMKMGLAYAVFLTEVRDGDSLSPPQLINEKLECIAAHCSLVEAEFNAATPTAEQGA